MAITGMLGAAAEESLTRPEVSAAVIEANNEASPPKSSQKIISGEVKAFAAPDIFNELIGKKIPGFRYMLYVATCETEQNWADKGSFGGGFGFMHKSNKIHKDFAAVQSTWLQWGGWEFAKVPWKATPKEQALVWIRAYATGWVRPNGVYKPPSRLPKNNCSGAMKVGWHTYKGQQWPVPDTWQKGDPQVKPWDK